MNGWKISKKVLKENYKEYRFDQTSLSLDTFSDLDELIFESVQYRSPENLDPRFIVEEGLIQTYPAEIVRNYVLKNFPELDPSQVRLEPIPSGANKVIFDHILMLIPDIGKNIERISQWMRLCGYTLTLKNVQSFSEDDSQKWVTLVFGPDFQKPVVMDGEKYLWHIAPKKYEKSILEKGFIPRSKNSLFNYPDRVYFFLGSMSEKDVVGLGYKLYKAQSKVEKASNRVDPSKYVLYKVALYRMPGCKFYVDPSWKGKAVYATENIPPSVIESRKDIDYSGWF